MQRMPARPGDSVANIETPALIVDLDPFERNLELMANAVRGSGVALRPHAKSHKCPEIAKRQVALGAAGICCQKVDESAAFVEAGIPYVLVTNEIVAGPNPARLAGLARAAAIGVLVDDVTVVAAISDAATSVGATIDVLVEIDVGAHRCGVAPGPAALTLARAIAAAPGLHFRGLHAYHGAAQHLRSPAQRRDAIAAAVTHARRARDEIVRAGIACPTVTGAGTGTWQLERDSGTYTEIQPGSYIFVDTDYGRNALAPDEHLPANLYVVAAVMSVQRRSAIIDAASSPHAIGAAGVFTRRRTDLREVDQHGVLTSTRPLRNGSRRARLADPRHCDPTVNLTFGRQRARRPRRMRVANAARGALGSKTNLKNCCADWSGSRR